MKRVIVTGVSEGLGYELAKIFLEKGVEVVGLSRTKPDIKINHIFVDFTKESDLEKAIVTIKDKYGEFDAIINCAGILSIEKIDKIKYEELDKVFKVNVFAPVLLVSKLTKLIKENESDIVNVSSTVGLKAYEDQCVYGASKWSIRGVTENFQTEFKGTKTRVIGFHPGGFKSRLFEKATGESADLSNFMEPKDIAKFMVTILELPKNMEVSHVVINRK